MLRKEKRKNEGKRERKKKEVKTERSKAAVLPTETDKKRKRKDHKRRVDERTNEMDEEELGARSSHTCSTAASLPA